MREIRKCKICGREFIAKRKNQIYCDKSCTAKAGVLATKERRKAKAAAEKSKPKRSISDINEEARAAGMTYGQYVAMQYAKTVRIGGTNESEM